MLGRLLSRLGLTGGNSIDDLYNALRRYDWKPGPKPLLVPERQGMFVVQESPVLVEHVAATICDKACTVNTRTLLLRQWEAQLRKAVQQREASARA